LLRSAGTQRVGGAPDRVPECVREDAELLLDEHLVEHTKALAAPLGRHVDRVQAQFAHARRDLRVRLGPEPVLLLAVELVLLDRASQRAGPRAQLLLVGGECEINDFSWSEG
jgi:hypothetical protein